MHYMDSINFSIYDPTLLCKIMQNNNSDKGHSDIKIAWHNYIVNYLKILNQKEYLNSVLVLLM